jgi:hypothetical protein
LDKLVRFFVVFSAGAILVACGNIKTEDGDKSLLPSSSGKYGEVLIVVDTFYENRATGIAINEIFSVALDGLPQQENQFRASTVPTKAFQSILKRSRNVLKLSIGKGKKTAINIEDDVWAKDQLLIQITAASDIDAARILTKNVQTIRDYFNERELSRLQRQHRGKPQKEVMKKIEESYKVTLTIPPGFMQMAKNDSGFWLKKEKSIGQHQILQGISVYVRPYITDTIFNSTVMIPYRNEFTKEMIQGSVDSSYMVVYEEYKPMTKEVNLNGVYAMEYRGLWNMENDFMGGPFLHYTLVDEKNKRVIEVDAFVFAPKFDKREYLRELEAIVKTVRIAS